MEIKADIRMQIPWANEKITPPDDRPVNWIKCLNRLVDTLPHQMIEGIPALKIAVEQARAAIMQGPDQDTCKELYERVTKARLLRDPPRRAPTA